MVSVVPHTNTLLIEWKGDELTNIEEYLGPNGTKLWKVKKILSQLH
jgi:hypothetical protein